MINDRRQSQKRVLGLLIIFLAGWPIACQRKAKATDILPYKTPTSRSISGSTTSFQE